MSGRSIGRSPLPDLNEKAELGRLESGRWEVLRILHVGGRLGATDSMVLSTLRAMWPQTTREWVRDQLQYLEDRNLLVLERHEIKDWRARLNRNGVDLVTYVIPCGPGIDRPEKYWGDEADS